MFEQFNKMVDDIKEKMKNADSSSFSSEKEEDVNDKEKEYVSFNDFKNICKKFDLIAELDSDYKKEDNNYCKLSLYFMKKFDNDQKPIKFNFLNSSDLNYYYSNRDIFEYLEDFLKNHIITISGDKDSKIILIV